MRDAYAYPMRFRRCTRWHRRRARSVARILSIIAIVHASGPLDKPWKVHHVYVRVHHMPETQRRSNMTRATRERNFTVGGG
jgi:hypothetical protein